MYDVTGFMDDHPGGDEVLLAATGNISLHIHIFLGRPNPIPSYLCNLAQPSIKILAGKDATSDFDDIGHSNSAKEMVDKYYLGEIDVSSIPVKLKYVPPQKSSYNPDKSTDFIIKILQFVVPLLILALAFAVRHYTKSE